MGPAQYPCKAPRTINILFHFLSQVCFHECLSYTVYKRGCKRSVWSGYAKTDPRSLPPGSVASDSAEGGSAAPPPTSTPPHTPRATDVHSSLPFISSPTPSAQRSLPPARLRSAGLRREENRQILAGASHSRTARPTGARPVTLAAERIPTAPARRRGGEAPG